MDQPYLYWTAAIVMVAVVMGLLFSAYDGGFLGH